MPFCSSRCLLPLAVLALFPSGSWCLEKPAPQPVTGKISWVFDYQQAKAQSAATGMPMFVVFRCER